MFCGIDLRAFRSIIKKKELTKWLFRRDSVFCEKKKILENLYKDLKHYLKKKIQERPSHRKCPTSILLSS